MKVVKADDHKLFAVLNIHGDIILYYMKEELAPEFVARTLDEDGIKPGKNFWEIQAGQALGYLGASK